MEINHEAGASSGHQAGETPILYFGTPVVLVSTLNETGTANLSPMSSAWWLGWRCMLGFDASSKTVENLQRTGQCVLNLPSAEMAAVVDRLARTTGSDPVPAHKQRRGYRHEADKFATAGLTTQPSITVVPPRAAQCPVQLEAVVEATHPLKQDDAQQAGSTVAVETRVQRVHLARELLADDDPDRIDPDKWRPLIMSFQRFYGLAATELAPSSLAQVSGAGGPTASQMRSNPLRPISPGVSPLEDRLRERLTLAGLAAYTARPTKPARRAYASASSATATAGANGPSSERASAGT